MVNTPTDNYITWARRAYPDEKTKLFPIPAERLCLYIKYTSFPIDHTLSLITYLSSHPKHGSEWFVRMREHPVIVELLNSQQKKGNKLSESSHAMKSKFVAVETEKTRGYMVVSDKNEHDPIQQIPKAPKEFIKPSTPPVISKTIPVQLTGKEKRKKLLKGLAEKDKIEAEKRKLREEIQKKDKEINRLNALLKQYEYLLIDEPEQECFIHL